MVEDSSNFRRPNETSNEASSSGNCLVTVRPYSNYTLVCNFRRPYSYRVSRKKVYFLKSFFEFESLIAMRNSWVCKFLCMTKLFKLKL